MDILKKSARDLDRVQREIHSELTRNGYEVIVATGAEEAFAKLLSVLGDAFRVDTSMPPGKTGAG